MTTRPLWDKGTTTPDADVMAFLAGEDILLDRHLFPWDIAASKAHVRSLGRIHVLTTPEVEALTHALDDIAQEYLSGALRLEPPHEDGHSVIEDALTQRLGDLGKKVHTGRSRNDQVLVAQRLWTRDMLAQAASSCSQIAAAALDRADADAMTPMPGYTHLQRAMPSSVGLWMASVAEAFIDDLELLTLTSRWLDANPLGTAAGYGVNLPLDRDGVTQELGFARTQLNPMYAQNSRGKFEIQALSAIGAALLDTRRLAWDLSLYTSAEFNFIKLPAQYTTGSSIMPNKRNPDVVELLRAAYAPVAAARVELEQLLSLPSGYHRDLQGTKGPLIRAITHALHALRLVAPLLTDMQLLIDDMAAAISPDMYATDRAVELTSSGVPFRDAYRQVAAELDQLHDRDPASSLLARTSPGACAHLQLDSLRQRLLDVTHHTK
jgi:argininosuccinate lyase